VWSLTNCTTQKEPDTSGARAVRTDMQRACMTPADRKTDTRRKIQLGGLIIKAGLASEEPAVLLGMLTAGARVLNAPNAVESRRRWKELGDRAFGSATKH
jgi:hypothetical protein